MGREGGAKVSESTRRTMGARVVLTVAALVLLSAHATTALKICNTNKNSVTLAPYETAFIGTNKLLTKVSVEAAGCINVTQALSLWHSTVTNVTSWSQQKVKWYEFTNCGNNEAKVGSKLVKFRPQKCSSKPITLSVGSSVLLGKKCPRFASWMDKQVTKHACSMLQLQTLLDEDSKGSKTSDPFRFASADNDNDDKNFFGTPELHLFGQQDSKKFEVDDKIPFNKWPYDPLDDLLQRTPAPLPSYNVHDNYFSKRRNYKENAIPIFIGIVLLTVSMCLRFCLCRGKSVVRRVTTVTVIRARPAGSCDAPQDQQDPPPSYIDVVNETTSPQNSTNEGSVEPPPPAYADIVDENLPPTYSEVEAQSQSTTSEEAPLANHEAEGHTTQPPPDPGAGPDDKSSASPTKNKLSKYRSQQKQFAFKVLEEDE